MGKSKELAELGAAVTVDGSNIGIGTSSPNKLMHLKANSPVINLHSDNASSAQISFTNSGGVSEQGFIKYEHSGDYAGSMQFRTSGSERMRIDSSGNVGIGTSSPSISPLHIRKSDADVNVLLQADNSRNSQVLFGDTDDLDVGKIKYNHPSNYMAFTVNTSERMRIDSSGNLLVGTTSTPLTLITTSTVEGIGLEGNTPYFGVSRSSGTTAYFNRLTSDGDIMQFRKDGATVGSISTFGDGIVFGNASSSAYANLRYTNDEVFPCTTTGGTNDNAIDLGKSNARFDDIYATNGNIQTSDRNEKQDVAALTATEMLVAARISGLFKTFRWIDSVADKGANARTHTGVIAQDVQAAFTAEGLDAGDYALFTSATWWETQTDVPAVEADEDNEIEAADAYTRTDTFDTLDEAPAGATERTRMGIRYPELLAFVGAYNEQRFASIETRLAALES